MDMSSSNESSAPTAVTAQLACESASGRGRWGSRNASTATGVGSPPARSAGIPRLRRAAGGLSALALAALAGPADAQITQASDVAILELGAPSTVDFTINATIPVPPGTYPRADGKSPFCIRDRDGTLVPAQVEPVTWYPKKIQEGADVLEVVARVQGPPNPSPDDRLFYSVVSAPTAETGPALTQTVIDFMGSRESMRLETKDVFGNRYDVDLRKGKYGVKTLKSGRWLEQKRFYGVMKPKKVVQGSTGTLNHLFGVHSYVTTYSGEDIIQVDLRVHNGMSGLDKSDPIDDPNAKIYFESLDLRVPKGWTVIQSFDDPMVGAPIYKARKTLFPLVQPNQDGTMHVFPQQSQMNRRLVITPEGNEARARAVLEAEWLGFVKSWTNSVTQNTMWSWWKPTTARFFPQNIPMPDLLHIGASSCRSKLSSDLNLFSGHMANGTQMYAYPLHTVRLGWSHPWGVKYGGMTSGAEIFLYDGMTTAWGASKDGYRMHQLRHRMYSDRHPTTIFNKDGEPTQLEQWVQGSGANQYVYMNFYMRLLPGSNDPFGFTQAPVWQVNAVQGANLDPWYESDLFAHENIDMQHLIRYTHSPKVLMWLGNDSLAKDDLRMQAEIVKLSYHSYYVSPNQGVIVSGMLDDQLFVQNNPGKGFSFGRGPSWAIDTMATAYAMGDDAYRARSIDWFLEITDLVTKGQSTCNGFVQSLISNKMLQGQHRARQSIEQAMTEHALWGVMETVFRGPYPGQTDRIDDIIVRSTYAMIGSLAWDPVKFGPHSILAVGPLALNQQPYCTSASFPATGGIQGGVDNYQTWSSFAYGYLLTGDNQFLDRVMEMTKTNKPTFNAAMETTAFGNLENRYGALSLSQRVDYP